MTDDTAAGPPALDTRVPAAALVKGQRLGLALLVSGAASYILLTRQRDAMAGALSRRLTSFRSRLDAGTRAEDND